MLKNNLLVHIKILVYFFDKIKNIYLLAPGNFC